jgi:hypothetical protein
MMRREARPSIPVIAWIFGVSEKGLSFPNHEICFAASADNQ